MARVIRMATADPAGSRLPLDSHVKCDVHAIPSSIQHSFPEALFRSGVLADWLELRAAWNDGMETAGPGHKLGAKDLYFGCKPGLTEQKPLRPEMSFVLQATVPTGGSMQVNRAVDDGTGAASTSFAQSWTVNDSLAEQPGADPEWFAFVPSAAGTAATKHDADGGFTFRPPKNGQWDGRGGVGLNAAAAADFVGAG